MVNLRPSLFGALRYVVHIILPLSHYVHAANNPILRYCHNMWMYCVCGLLCHSIHVRICIYHFVHILYSPAVQVDRSKGCFHPSQVQTAPLHQSTQSTVPLTQPPVTACTTSTYLMPPEMTTPPHMVAHTGMSLVSRQKPSSFVPRSRPASHYSMVSK